jgi:hypothetical protein
MSKTLLIAAVSAVFFGFASISGTPALAAAKACKGMAMSACDAEATCSWVKSYKNKSGKSVAAHCRAKGKKAVKKKEPAKPKTN